MAELINKAFYDDVTNQMLALEEQGQKPTVSDMIAAVGKKGNRDYYMANLDVFHSYAEETPFKARGSIIHEIAHLFPKLGHTPQQEMFLTNFLLGITHRKLREPIYKEFYERHIKEFRGHVDDYTKRNTYEKWQHFSKQNASIYFAAGLYAKQKIAALTQDDLPHDNYDIMHQKAMDYAKPESDSLPVALDKMEGEMLNRIEKMSWRLVEISPKEWRSIIAVATQKLDAKATDYPKRMQPIQDTLKSLGFYDELTTPFHKGNSGHAR